MTVFTRRERSPCESCGRGSRGASGAGTTRASRRRLGAEARRAKIVGVDAGKCVSSRRDGLSAAMRVVHAASYSLLTRRRASTSGRTVWVGERPRAPPRVVLQNSRGLADLASRAGSALASGTAANAKCRVSRSRRPRTPVRPSSSFSARPVRSAAARTIGRPVVLSRRGARRRRRRSRHPPSEEIGAAFRATLAKPSSKVSANQAPGRCPPPSASSPNRPPGHRLDEHAFDVKLKELGVDTQRGRTGSMAW